MSSTKLYIKDADSFSEAAMALATTAQLSLKIYSSDLMEPIFRSEEFYSEVKRIALAHPNSSINLLIENSKPITLNGHPLLRIVQRLTSTVELRCVPANEEMPVQIIMLGDKSHFVEIRAKDGFSGAAIFANAVGFQTLDMEFSRWWDISSTPIELRRLSL